MLVRTLLGCSLVALVMGCDSTSPPSPATRDIHGTVELAPGANVPPGGAVFIIARGPSGSAPMAVLRLSDMSFPQPFSIGPADVVTPDSEFVGPIFLGARADTDGDVATRHPTDLGAIAQTVLEPGASGIRLVLAPAPAPRTEPVPETAPTRSADPESIRGRLRLGPGVAEPAPGATVFLVLRTGEGGPPLAAKKLRANAFPLAFEIGPSDVMVPGRAFSGPMFLTARVDSDGDASTKQPGDPSSEVPMPARPGASDLEIVLVIRE